MFLARKISRAKWNAAVRLPQVRADAITSDLRTQHDELSFWQCDPGAPDPDNPALNGNPVSDIAMAIASPNPSLGKFDIIWFSVDDLENDDQSWVYAKAETPIEDLNSLHLHARELNYLRLGNLAQRIIDAIDQKRFERFDPDRVVNLLTDAINGKRLKLDDLKGKVHDEVQRKLSAQ